MKYFKPEDFICALSMGDLGIIDLESRNFLAIMANAKLQKLIKASPVVYAKEYPAEKFIWSSLKEATHQARLMFIEPIVKECLQHEPEYPVMVSLAEYGAFVELLNGTKKCKHCGVELKATWEAVK